MVGVVNAVAAENQANVILSSVICKYVLSFGGSNDLCLGLDCNTTQLPRISLVNCQM
jgi:hypothetical protein